MVHEALSKAADLYQQSGDRARAWRCSSAWCSEYPTPVPDAIEVRQRLVDIATQRRRLRSARYYWQREIVRGRCDRRRGAHRSHHATWPRRRQLALAAPVRDEFRGIKLVAPLKRTPAGEEESAGGGGAGLQARSPPIRWPRPPPLPPTRPPSCIARWRRICWPPSGPSDCRPTSSSSTSRCWRSRPIRSRSRRSRSTRSMPSASRTACTTIRCARASPHWRS